MLSPAFQRRKASRAREIADQVAGSSARCRLHCVHIMHLRHALPLATATLVLGSFLATASAMTITAVSCDDLKAQLKHYRQGSFTYQRAKAEYEKECALIKSGCPSEATLKIAEKSCKGAGEYSVRYDDASGCSQVTCALTAPFSSSSSSSSSVASSSSNAVCPSGDELFKQGLACKEAQKKINYMIVNGCHVVQCIDDSQPQTSCPTADEMRKKAAACKSVGQNYAYYTVGICQAVRCNNDAVGGIGVTCPNNDSINVSALQCRKQGLGAKIILDKNGCRTVQCKMQAPPPSLACPTNDQLDAAIKICKNSGMNYTSLPDDVGCRQVLCQAVTSGGVDTGGSKAQPQNARCIAQPSALVCRVRKN